MPLPIHDPLTRTTCSLCPRQTRQTYGKQKPSFVAYWWHYEDGYSRVHVMQLRERKRGGGRRKEGYIDWRVARIGAPRSWTMGRFRRRTTVDADTIGRVEIYCRGLQGGMIFGMESGMF